MSKKIVRLTEADLTRLIRRVLKEQPQPGPLDGIKQCFGSEIPSNCTNIINALMKKGTPSMMDVMLCGAGLEGKVVTFFDCIKKQFPNFHPESY